VVGGAFPGRAGKVGVLLRKCRINVTCADSAVDAVVRQLFSFQAEARNRLAGDLGRCE